MIRSCIARAMVGFVLGLASCSTPKQKPEPDTSLVAPPADLVFGDIYVIGPDTHDCWHAYGSAISTGEDIHVHLGHFVQALAVAKTESGEEVFDSRQWMIDFERKGFRATFTNERPLTFAGILTGHLVLSDWTKPVMIQWDADIGHPMDGRPVRRTYKTRLHIRQPEYKRSPTSR
jgi:hypothetical protein